MEGAEAAEGLQSAIYVFQAPAAVIGWLIGVSQIVLSALPRRLVL